MVSDVMWQLSCSGAGFSSGTGGLRPDSARLQISARQQENDQTDIPLQSCCCLFLCKLAWGFVGLRGASCGFVGLRGPSWGFVGLRGPSWAFVGLRGTCVHLRAAEGHVRGPSCCPPSLRGTLNHPATPNLRQSLRIPPAFRPQTHPNPK